MNEQKLLERITINPQIFRGKPIIMGRRLAVEHILGMLAAGDTFEKLKLRFAHPTITSFTEIFSQSINFIHCTKASFDRIMIGVFEN